MVHVWQEESLVSAWALTGAVGGRVCSTAVHARCTSKHAAPASQVSWEARWELPRATYTDRIASDHWRIFIAVGR